MRFSIKLYIFLKKPCELSFTEPSTWRQIIRHYYNISSSKPQLSVNEVSICMAKDLLTIWSSVNPKLPLILEDSIRKKLNALVSTVKSINVKKCKLAVKTNLEKMLDKLFDITACSCGLVIHPCDHKLVKCFKVNCSDKHIVCLCPTNARVPLEERAYLLDQRNKIGPKGLYQISTVDRTAHVGENKSDAQKIYKEKLDNPASLANADLQYISDSSSDSSSTKEQIDEAWLPKGSSSLSAHYSSLKFNRFAFELVRAGISSRVGAALANALIMDINKFIPLRVVDLDAIMTDKNKIERAKQKVKILSEDNVENQKFNLTCIGIDGKVDNSTLISKEEVFSEKPLIRRTIGPEHHLTFTCESGDHSGSYLTHRTIPLLGATGEVMARETYHVLNNYESAESLAGVLVDNTAVNTGHKNGLVVHLEKLLEKRLHTIGCSLHQNELPLKMLFRKLDGNPTGPNSFSGPIGKKCNEDLHLMEQIKFEVIDNDLTSFTIQDEVLNDLSNDQHLLLMYCNGISKGKVCERWASKKIGPLNHARWLTLGIRILALYVRTKDPPENLKKLANYVAKVYTPAWFQTKISSKLKDMANIIFNSSARLQTLPYDDVKAIVLKNMQGNAFALLPENFLYCIICDEDPNIRKKGLERILQIRAGEIHTSKQIPEINWLANTWHDLIDVREIYCEPPVTEKFLITEIQKFIDDSSKPDLPTFPAHSQSVERAVQEVSKVSANVYGNESRHQTLLCKMMSRDLRPDFVSKGYYTQSYSTLL